MTDNTDDPRAARAREIKRAYTSAYNAKHREERAAYMKEWEEKNKEARNAYRREYYAENRERMIADSAARGKEWVEKNPERRREIQRKYREKNREKLREANRTYILESPTYAASHGRKRKKRAADLVTLAGRPCPDVCEICAHAPDAGKALHFDHCHAQGNFRGWICRSCNLALGNVEDNIQRLEQLIAYLRRSQTA